MSLFDNDIIYIKLYYKVEVNGKNKKMTFYGDEEGEKLFENKESGVEVIETEWKNLTWDGSNKIVDYATEKTEEGPKFNYIKYRDAVLKKCLTKWNLMHKEQPVPVNSEAINRLPLVIVAKLFTKFEKNNDYTDKDLGK